MRPVEPYRRDQTLYAPCINGPYYREHIPSILKEIASTYKPEGFTDNSWSGLSRGSICYCANCRDAFHRASNMDLPQRADWTATDYRAWIEWSYATRLEIWDLYNKTAREAGGPACLWVGMMNGALSAASSAFRDYREICRRAEIIMLDNQQRGESGGFQTNGQTGKLVHGMLGWDKLAPESFALYQTAGATFRLASRREPEARMWAIAGAAGGIQPWWHYVTAYREDRRQYETPVALAEWMARNQDYLINRQPIATVGILYSQRNTDFFGRDDVEAQVNQPQRGFSQALTRARIPFLFVNADDIAREAGSLRILILPNLGLLTDEQAEAIAAFSRRGGSVIATGASSLFDRWGEPRADFALAGLFGMHVPSDHPWRDPARRRQLAAENVQTYLRLTPELRAGVYGPHVANEPSAAGQRHPIMNGFEKTDLLPFGGSLPALVRDTAASVQPLLTFVPPLPAFPPESVWSRDTRTSIPGLVFRDGSSRVVYMPADLDRRYARDNNPDHGDLLANAVRWAAGEDGIPLKVEGRGFLDWHVYRQADRLVLHCVNLTNEGAWRAPVDELIPVGPLRVQLNVPAGFRARHVRLLVAGHTIPARVQGAWTQFELASVLDHEVMVVE